MIRRLIAPTALALGLLVAPAVRAQEEVAPMGEEESKGKPIYGYIATAFLASGAVFILCKSSRR